MALRSGALALSRTFRAPSRAASDWAPSRWSEQVRTASKDITADCPPTAPLHETHEMGEGLGDFSNWIESHDDTSLTQALVGAGFMFSVCGALYAASQHMAKNSTPMFTLRELPEVEGDIPTFKFDNGDPRATRK